MMTEPYTHMHIHTVLHVQPRFVIRHDVSLCGSRQIYVTYRDMTSMEHVQCCRCGVCGGMHCMDVAQLGTFVPGMGCASRACRRTLQTLQKRKLAKPPLPKQSRTRTQQQSSTSTAQSSAHTIDSSWQQQMQEQMVALTEKMDVLLLQNNVTQNNPATTTTTTRTSTLHTPNPYNLISSPPWTVTMADRRDD